MLKHLCNPPDCHPPPSLWLDFCCSACIMIAFRDKISIAINFYWTFKPIVVSLQPPTSSWNVFFLIQYYFKLIWVISIDQDQPAAPSPYVTSQLCLMASLCRDWGGSPTLAFPCTSARTIICAQTNGPQHTARQRRRLLQIDWPLKELAQPNGA